MADYPVRGHWFLIQFVMPVLCLLVGACSTSHRIENSLFVGGPQGTVSLQSVDDASFRTAHPVSVSPQLLTHILRGIQALPDDSNTAMHVFSNNETKFLSPLLSAVLSQATQNQVVTFRLIRGESSKNEVLDGTIYIHGRLLHLNLTNSQGRPHKGRSDDEQDHASLRLGEAEPPQLAFIPEADQRSSSDEQGDPVMPPLVGTLVIDYQMFGDALGLASPSIRSQLLPAGPPPCPHTDLSATLPDHEAPAFQEAPSPGAQDAQVLKELVCEQAIELNSLKEDMRALHHILSEIEENKKHPSTKPKLHAPLQMPIPNAVGSRPHSVRAFTQNTMRRVLR